MTTVAALAHDGAVWMAADTLANVYDRPITGFRKIRRLKAGDGAEFLVGCSGQADAVGRFRGPEGRNHAG